MARVNVYLPDELAAEAREAGLNVSSVAQEALRREIAARRSSEWVKRALAVRPAGVSHEEALSALHAARDEMGLRHG
ncbi:MAG TPA: antitoxin [Actinobacteria bacterium]|jgi:post-segregation antitoxin (ccd killing protein)|nr:antitoxin [Actinomycetota bacterium]